MFDQKPQKPLLMPAAERPPESFETRVLRELAAMCERLAKVEDIISKPAQPAAMCETSAVPYEDLRRTLMVRIAAASPPLEVLRANADLSRGNPISRARD